MSRVVWDVTDAPGEGADGERMVVVCASLDRTTGALLCSPTTNSTRMKAARTAAIPKICGRLIGGNRADGLKLHPEAAAVVPATWGCGILWVEHEAAGQDLALHLFGQDLHAVLAAAPRFDRLIDRDASAVPKPAITIQYPQLPALIDGDDRDLEQLPVVPEGE